MLGDFKDSNSMLNKLFSFYNFMNTAKYRAF